MSNYEILNLSAAKNSNNPYNCIYHELRSGDKIRYIGAEWRYSVNGENITIKYGDIFTFGYYDDDGPMEQRIIHTLENSNIYRWAWKFEFVVHNVTSVFLDDSLFEVE